MSRPLAAHVIHGIGTLVTPARVPAPIRGADLGAVEEIANAAIAISSDGRILAAGAQDEVRSAITTDDDTQFFDAHGALAIPGLVDCHAHPVFAGDRSAEFELRNLGADYEQIHAAGGGIRATVAHTRAALADGSITQQIRTHFNWMLAAGTTTSECKSGYALTLDGEVDSLAIAQQVAAEHPLRTTRTILAAHTIPEEYSGRGDAYIEDVAIPAVQRVAQDGLASAADIFLERGSFTSDQARTYLAAARQAGLKLRIHGDQFSDQGSIPLAVELGARSVDHLEALEATDERLAHLAAADTAAVLLPLSSLMLSRPYAPGRALADAGAIIAVASDFNPGSSYGESLTLALSLACIGNRLRVAEALTAVTVNAAWVLGLDDRVGRLDVGYRGDVVLLDQPALGHLPYHVGSPGIQAVFVGGLEVSPAHA